MVAASLAPGLEQIVVAAFVFQQSLTSGVQPAATGTALVLLWTLSVGSGQRQ
jgi:hypothetical protein